MHFRFTLALLVLLPAAAVAQRREVIVLFKDGFRLQGKVIEKRDVISDPGGAVISVPASGAFMYLDDQARRMHFPYSQAQDVVPRKPEDLKDLIVIKRPGAGNTGDRVLPGWEFESVSAWNSKWERTIQVNSPRGRMEIDQRITTLTPYYAGVITLRYDWMPYYLTKELGLDLTRQLLGKYYADKKEMKDSERRLHIAKFLYQAGWYDAAQRELDIIVKEFAGQKKAVEPLQEIIDATRANVLVEELERVVKIGQPSAALERFTYLDRSPNLTKLLSDKNRLLLTDLKSKLETSKEKIAQVKDALKELPGKLNGSGKKIWEDALAWMVDAVNHDTVGRLETFSVFAQQHLRELKDNKKPTQKAEEVLALAVTGWLQGNSAAEPDVKLARQLLSARQSILDLQQADNPLIRKQIADSLTKENDLPIDMVARLIKMLPPPAPPEKIPTDLVKLDIEVPNGQNGTYFLQLPPDYHPNRSYPVLLLLHGARDTAANMVQRFTGLAAQHGFILAGPVWGKGLRPSYNYTANEHAIVLDTLRDLRRRFQVDSDRVFMLGWEQGAEMAYDLGLSHPDQFAGVLPMNGVARTFSLKYHTNGQYLPFYVVDGDHNGAGAKATRSIFKDWIRWHYPSLYVEYKGRGSEWYGAETITMFDWMSRKKRHHPMKELGRHHTGGLAGEEFKTMRETDNKFYWLGCDGISERCLNDHKTFDNKIFPATLQASVHTGNELVVKSGGVKDANIWNQINVRAANVNQVTIWLTPNLIDYSKPLTVRINGGVAMTNRKVQPSLPVMLEEFFSSGDRQRLFYAKLEFKL